MYLFISLSGGSWKIFICRTTFFIKEHFWKVVNRECINKWIKVNSWENTTLNSLLNEATSELLELLQRNIQTSLYIYMTTLVTIPRQSEISCLLDKIYMCMDKNHLHVHCNSLICKRTAGQWNTDINWKVDRDRMLDFFSTFQSLPCYFLAMPCQLTLTVHRTVVFTIFVLLQAETEQRSMLSSLQPFLFLFLCHLNKLPSTLQPSRQCSVPLALPDRFFNAQPGIPAFPSLAWCHHISHSCAVTVTLPS